MVPSGGHGIRPRKGILSMGRRFCRVLAGLLAGAGLACGLATSAFAQAPLPAGPVAVRPGGQVQEPDAAPPSHPADLAPAPPAPPVQESDAVVTVDSTDVPRPSRWYASAEGLRWWFKG